MRPYLAEVLDRAFGTDVFRYLLPNYLILLCTGAFVGTVYAARRARARGLNPEIYYGLVLWALPAALLGGRVMGFLYAPESYGGSLLALLDPLRGDSAAYGGFIGGTAAGVGYMLVRRVDVWRYLDCAGPPLGVAAAFTRVGCFLDGCDFGAIAVGWPLAVAFPAGSPAHQAHLEAGLISSQANWSLPVHPVQLYLALNNLLLAAAIAGWSRRPDRPPGESFLGFWALYAMTRFGLEFLRGDSARGFLGALSTSQVISIPLLALTVMLIAARRRTSWEPLLEGVVVTAMGALLHRLCLEMGGWGKGLGPAVWIYLPLGWILLRRRPLAELGASPGPWRRGILFAGASVALLLVPFAAAVLLMKAAPGTEWTLDERLRDPWTPVLLLLLAIPEEVFFRGFLHGRLKSWSAARGWSSSLPTVLLGALLFALAHLLVEPGWARALVFFPGIAMGWLRERSGGLLAPLGFHWLANLTWMALGLAG